MIKTNKNIILASSSPIRKKILSDLNIKFDVVAPICDEEKEKEEYFKQNKNINFLDLALFLATKKALSVSCKVKDSYIIGSDQVCEFEEGEVKKSKNIDEVISQLLKFSGKIHKQNNAVVVAYNNDIVFSSTSCVDMHMRCLREDEIIKYAKTENPVGCAGSYQYESFGKYLFEKINGDYYSVLGLQIQPLINYLINNQVLSL